MVSGMVEESAGKFSIFLIAARNVLICCRSLRNFDDWNEIIDFKGDLTCDIKTLATVDEFRRNPAFRMSVIQKRKINLSVINSWLQNRHDLDELVVESLSEYFAYSSVFDSSS